ncbi:MAG TPA: hypothetical protein VHD32_08410 [Candidatus Didemnitutus sp.]|nr:hypothetical protein [Candidatus Didemnitutus sp.]
MRILLFVSVLGILGSTAVLLIALKKGAADESKRKAKPQRSEE